MAKKPLSHHVKSLIARPGRLGAALPVIVVMLVAVAGYLAVHQSSAATLVGDLNNDGVVNVFDLSIMLSDWGTANTTVDLNNDGSVNVFDLSTLLSHWGQTAAPTPTPTPSNTPTPAPTPSSSPEAWSCITSDMDTSSFNANCPQGFGNFYTTYPGITDNGSPDNGRDQLNVNQNVWGSGGTDYTQTLYSNSPGDWKIVGNVTNNTSGQVLTFPATGWYPATNLVDSYKSITSSWNVTMPTLDQVNVGWAAYDLWFNGWNDEVMIQTDVVSNSDYDCTVADTLTVSGVTWSMCEFGGERVWRPGSQWNQMHNQASGSVDILAIIKHMETDNAEPDKLPANSTLYAMSFGFEVCHTHGPQTFEVNDFTWNAQQ